MSWDAPPPGEPQQPPQPHGQPPQPYFPTQPYDQPPPQWPQPQDGQYGGPYFPPHSNAHYPAPPPPRRSRAGFYIAISAVAVVVAAGVAVGVAATSSKSGNGTPSALAASSSAAAATTGAAPTDAASGAGSAQSQSPHTVITPASAGPLNLLSNADTKRRIAKIASGLSGNAAYRNPKIGFYSVGSGSSYSVWMLAEASSDAPAFKSSVNVLGDAAMARQIADGAKMADVTSQSPGPLGGSLLCGKLALSGSQFRVCEWVDDSSFGWVYFMPSVNEHDMLAYTLDLRSSAEQ